MMETYYWNTESSMECNSEAMNDFLDHEICLICDEYECVWLDGTQAKMKIDGKFYICDSSGNGDDFNHMIEFTECEA